MEDVSLYQQLLIGEALKSAAHSSPHQPAFVYEGEHLTFLSR